LVIHALFTSTPLGPSCHQNLEDTCALLGCHTLSKGLGVIFFQGSTEVLVSKDVMFDEGRILDLSTTSSPPIIRSMIFCHLPRGKTNAYL